MFYSTVVAPCLRLVFVGVLLIFIITWFFKKVSWFSKLWRQPYQSETKQDNKERESEYNTKQDAWKQNIQQVFSQKAARYKEETQLPRERAKRERKEKEFYKHFGPLWCGEGNALGREEDSPEEDDLDDQNNTSSDNVKAARRRKIQEPDPSAVAAAAAIKSIKPKIKSKRIIELPAEPDESDPDAISVIMRTPISTVVRRRFLLCHSVQSLMDFMTTSGFSYLRYQLCASFPRLVLSDPKVSLSDLGFRKRITLNIEDKAFDDS